MSWLGDALGFEAFQIGDMWDKIKDNPEQLFLGAATPVGAEIWGGILGKDYEPMVDMMGGPYGGSAFSAFGNNEGGVYGRAEEAGIDTGGAKGIHDVAHVVSGAMAGGYGADKMGGLFGTGGDGGGMGGFGNFPMPGGGGQPQQQQPHQMPMSQYRPSAPPMLETFPGKKKTQQELLAEVMQEGRFA
jgi:hypothetical protein